MIKIVDENLKLKEKIMSKYESLKARALKVIDFPMYSTEIYFFVEKKWGKLNDEISKLFGEKPGECSEKNCYGSTFLKQSDGKTTMVIIIGKDDTTLRTIGHELTHVVDRLVYINDITSIGESDSEWRANLMGWLLTEVCNTIHSTKGLRLKI
jgi:hypothetical protein